MPRPSVLLLPLFPVVLLVADLVSPTDSTDNGDQLAAAAAHSGAWQAAALLELLAAILLPIAVAAALRGVAGRVATSARVVGVLGGMGMTLIASRHLFVYGLTAVDHASALAVLDRIDGSAADVAILFMIAGPLSLIVLAAALLRAGVVGRAVVVGAVLFFVSDMLPIPAEEIVQMLIGIATFGYVALRLREPRESLSSRPAVA
jgi:hypothetical protein